MTSLASLGKISRELGSDVSSKRPITSTVLIKELMLYISHCRESPEIFDYILACAEFRFMWTRRPQQVICSYYKCNCLIPLFIYWDHSVFGVEKKVSVQFVWTKY